MSNDTITMGGESPDDTIPVFTNGEGNISLPTSTNGYGINMPAVADFLGDLIKQGVGVAGTIAQSKAAAQNVVKTAPAIASAQESAMSTTTKKWLLYGGIAAAVIVAGVFVMRAMRGRK